MKTIIINTDTKEKFSNLVEILNFVFPECEIKIQSPQKGHLKINQNFPDIGHFKAELVRNMMDETQSVNTAKAI